MRVAHLSWGCVWVGIAGLTLGCNAVLNNQSQLETSDAATELEAGSPPFDALAPLPILDATILPPDAALPPRAIDSGTLPACTFGQKLCSGSCVAINSPLFGCGVSTCAPCSLAHATATCAGTGCAIAACDPGYADCDQSALDGCETDLAQPASCGTCNTDCPSSAPDCAPTATGGFVCSTGCSASAPTLCGNQCVDLQTSLDDCGECSAACPAVANGQPTCASGQCGFTCEADFHACGSACASDVSPATCGASCWPCPTGANAIPTCDGVECGIECEWGFADCDGVTSDGCEVNLLTDPRNCGWCGNSCEGRACNDGTCAAAPAPDAGPPPADSGPPPPSDAGSADSWRPPADAGESG